MIHLVTNPTKFLYPAKSATKTSIPEESSQTPVDQHLPSYEGSLAKFEVVHENIQAHDQTVPSPVDWDARPDFVKTSAGHMKQHEDGFTVSFSPSGDRLGDIEFNANGQNGTITVTEYTPPANKAGEPGGTLERYTLDTFQGLVTDYAQKVAPAGLPGNASIGDAVFGKPAAPDRGDDFQFSGEGISSSWLPNSEW